MVSISPAAINSYCLDLPIPVSRHASGMRTVIGIGLDAAGRVGSSIMGRVISSDCSSNRGLIGSSQPTADHFHERAISLKSKLPGFRVERRVMCNEGQLMLNEGAERFSNEVELPGKLLVGPAQPVEPDTKPFIKFGCATPLEPCTKGVGKDRSLR